VADLQDGRGCLTPSGLDAMEAAETGQAPPELARHLSECQRCQDRLLARARDGGKRGPRPTTGRLVMRTALVLVVILGALAALMATLFWLRSPG
jgi:hypothetical protein